MQMIRFALLALALAAPAAAVAETIDVLVRRPAAADEAYQLRSLAVERFGGTDGRALAIAVERELAGARGPGGRALFEIFDAGRGEGEVSGRADVDVEERRSTEKRRLCPNTNDRNAKCDDKEKAEVEVTCRTRIVALEADVRIVRAGDGRVVYSRALPGRDEVRWCAGDAAPPETAAVVARLIGRAASDAMGDLVPYARVTAIRIREDRKGLDKPASAAFKAAVLATRGDGREGCAQFAALAPQLPDHRALIFNLALCAEARGDYAAARDGYARVGDRDAGAAIDRVLATRAAADQEAAREGGRR